MKFMFPVSTLILMNILFTFIDMYLIKDTVKNEKNYRSLTGTRISRGAPETKEL